MSSDTKPFSSRALNPELRTLLPPLVLSRLWVAGFAYLGHYYDQFAPPVAGIWPGIDHPLLGVWTYFDSRFFLSIARHGYEPHSTAFFPLYPLLLRLAGPGETAMALWGIVLSNTAFALALWGLYHLTARDFNEATARRAVWILAFFPTTVFFSAVYTESCYLLFLIAAFLAVRQREKENGHRWRLAGGFALLAALTKNSGPLLFIALLLEWRRARRDSVDAAPPLLHTPSALLFIALPLLGFVAVQGCFAWMFGGASGVASQAVYGRALQAPWLPLWNDLSDIAAGRGGEMTIWLNLVVTVAAFWFAWQQWRRGNRSYAVLTAGIMLMQLIVARTYSPYTGDSTRYMSTAFPFVQMLALHAEVLTQSRLRLALAIFILLLVCAVLTFRFGVKSYVS